MFACLCVCVYVCVSVKSGGEGLLMLLEGQMYLGSCSALKIWDEETLRTDLRFPQETQKDEQTTPAVLLVVIYYDVITASLLHSSSTRELLLFFFSSFISYYFLRLTSSRVQPDLPQILSRFKALEGRGHILSYSAGGLQHRDLCRAHGSWQRLNRGKQCSGWFAVWKGDIHE